MMGKFLLLGLSIILLLMGCSTQKKATQYGKLGDVANAKGNYNEAIAMYQKAIALSPHYANAYNNLGTAYDMQGDYDLALEYYQKAVYIKPKFDTALYNIGRIYHLKLNYDTAILYYRKAIEYNPTYQYAYNNLGIIYHEQKKDDEEAIRCYEKVLAINPNNAITNNNLGNVYEKTDFDKAVGYYQKAITLDPKYVYAYLNLATMYNETSADSLSLQYYQKVIEIDPKNSEAYLNTGKIYSLHKDYTQAMNYYKKALAINPNNPSIFYEIGKVYYNQQERSQAINWFQKIVDTNFENYESAYMLMGSAYNNLKKYDEAIACYQKIIIYPKVNKLYIPIYMVWIAQTYKEQGNYSKAMEWYQKNIQENPDDEFGYCSIAKFYAQQHEYKKAIAYYQKTIDINNKGREESNDYLPISFAEAYNGQGNAYSNLDNYDDALRCYQQAINIYPDYSDTYCNMGIMYGKQGKLLQEKDCYEKAARLDDTMAIAWVLKKDNNRMNVFAQVKAYCEKGDSLFYARKYTLAIPYFQQAVLLNTRNADTYEKLGRTCYFGGVYKQAIMSYQKAIALKEDIGFYIDPSLYALIGGAYDKLKDQDKANDYYQKAIQLGLKNPKKWIDEHGYNNAFSENGYE